MMLGVRALAAVRGKGGVGSKSMKLSILSWNVRGLNQRDKRLRVSNMLRDWKVDIVCL
jgi:hypothetical protein